MTMKQTRIEFLDALSTVCESAPMKDREKLWNAFRAFEDARTYHERRSRSPIMKMILGAIESGLDDLAIEQTPPVNKDFDHMGLSEDKTDY